jgi:hypothetical protein
MSDFATETDMTSKKPTTYQRRPRPEAATFADGTKRTKMSVYLDSRVHKHLLRYCIDENTSQQQIMMEALDLWLAKNRQPSLGEMAPELLAEPITKK